MSHSKKLGLECRKRAEKKWGKPAWPMLSREQQQGAIALEVVSVVLSCINMTGDKSPVMQHCQEVASSALWSEDNET